MKMLNNVLIKLMRGGFTDRVLFIDNVPSEMFYEMQNPRKCVGEGQAQHWVPDFDKEKVPTLYPELQLSQTGDGGIVFNLDNEQSKHRFLALERYIKSVYPVNQVPPEPVVYSTDASDQSAPTLALSQVPRVVLPVLSPTGSSPATGGTTASLVLDPAAVEAIKKQAVEEYAAEEQRKLKERMEKARAGRTPKNAD